MNDFVLRGFCKKCEYPIKWQESIDWNESKHYGNLHKRHKSQKIETHKIEIEWFLSAKQIKIVHDSDVVHGIKNDWEAVYILLDENPFLVAKILKEAGEKENDKK